MIKTEHKNHSCAVCNKSHIEFSQATKCCLKVARLPEAVKVAERLSESRKCAICGKVIPIGWRAVKDEGLFKCAGHFYPAETRRIARHV